ncbi:MAG: penicillin-binding protein activator [Candidatus Firestonebacteria bacterium]
MKNISLAVYSFIVALACTLHGDITPEERSNSITPLPTERTVLTPRYEVKRKDLKLGVLLPLSGELAEQSTKVKNGVELAIRTFNKQYNAELVPVYLDTEKGDEALEEYYKAGNADPLFAGIIGPVQNDLLLKVKTLAENYRLVTISPSAAAVEKIKGNQYFFSDAVFPEDEGRVMAEFTVKNLKKKKAGVIYPSNNAYGKACALAYKEELKKLGGEVTKEEKFEEGSFDYKEQMLSLGGIDPRIVKDIMSGEKNNLESIVSKLVTQVRAFLPPATEKKKNGLVLVKFVNAGRETAQLTEETDYAQMISEKLSYGLGKFKDVKLPKMAEVKKYIARKGFDKTALAGYFDSSIVITGEIFEKTPLTYSAHVTVEKIEEKTAVEIAFDFSASDKLITNPEGLEVIYLPVSLFDAESIISHLAFFELRVPYLGSAVLNDRKFINNMKLSESEIYFTGAFNPASAIPEVAGFIQAYKEAYFEEPDYYAAAAFDAANILLHAIGRGAVTKEEVKNAVSNISSIDLVTGAAAYVEGGIKKDLHILGISGKELIEVK